MQMNEFKKLFVKLQYLLVDSYRYNAHTLTRSKSSSRSYHAAAASAAAVQRSTSEDRDMIDDCLDEDELDDDDIDNDAEEMMEGDEDDQVGSLSSFKVSRGVLRKT